MNTVDIHHGDCLGVLRELPDNSVDSIVTDPPYGLSNTKPAQVADVLAAWVTGDTEAAPTTKGGFMGKEWDRFVPPPAVWAECLRVLKPGGHMVVFAGARTQDLMGLSIRLAGFELRDTLGWVYGSGFPKSMDVSRAVDKAVGAEREVTRHATATREFEKGDTKSFDQRASAERERRDIPATPEAARWAGWGTALKPAIEPIILARKPLAGTVAQNVLAHGVGGLNIDACRVGSEVRHNPPVGDLSSIGSSRSAPKGEGVIVSGRFPANVLLDEHAAAEMDRQSGVTVSRSGGQRGTKVLGTMNDDGWQPTPMGRGGHNDSGGASRFFPVFRYQPKAPKRERPVIEREDGTKVQHPTVKPLALMEWLVTLITPPGGTTLDPFAGTGTTLQAARDKGFSAIGIEQDADYIQLINTRLCRVVTSSSPPHVTAGHDAHASHRRHVRRVTPDS